MPSPRSPLQVYLDSSDFSNLSDPVKREPFVEVERRLIAWRNEGLIDLRFSFVHVAEFAPIGPEHLSLARMRADCITRLCGSKTLKAPGDLIKSEVRSFVEKSSWMRDDSRDDNGNWMPAVFRQNIDLPSMPEMMSEAMTKAMADTPLNREARRKLKRQLMVTNGNGRTGSQDFVTVKLPGIVAELQEKYPLSKAGVQAARRYFLGKGSKVDVEEMMAGSLRDLRLFMDWYAKRWDMVTPVTSWLREEGANLHKSLSSGRTALVGMLEAERAIGTPEAVLALRMKEVLEQMPMNFVASILAAACPTDAPSMTRNDAERFLPGASVVARIATEVMASSIARLDTPRKAKSSDFGDVMHSIYLPYVDVFRVDGFVESAIRALKLPYRTIVVGNLMDLPSAIESRLLQ